MRKYKVVELFYMCVLFACAKQISDGSNIKKWEIRMPNVTVTEESYMCYAERVPKDGYIVKLESNVDLKHVHHLDVFRTNDLGPQYILDKVTDCEIQQPLRTNPSVVLNDLIYGTDHHAPSLALPKGFGYKIGADSRFQYMKLLAHYRGKMEVPDNSGVTIYYTTEKQKSVGGLTLMSQQEIKPGEIGYAEGACEWTMDVPIHPLVYRVHTHDLGTMVSAYAVQDGKWNLIGKRNPQKPQIFYPTKDMVIKKGDTIAWRCTYNNTKDHVVVTGDMNDDEMCNFFMNFWTDSDKKTDNTIAGLMCSTFASQNWKAAIDSKVNPLPPPPSNVE